MAAKEVLVIYENTPIAGEARAAAAQVGDTYTFPRAVDINDGTIDGAIIGANSPAACTVTTFTSTGIDDNTTGERVQIEDTHTIFGNGLTTSSYALINSVADGNFTFSGGSSSTLGARITFFGETHATQAGDIQIASVSGLEAFYDDGLSLWDFQANDIVTTNDITCNYVKKGVTSGITASVTQTQGQGALTKAVNEISTVATTNDTVTLPSAEAGVSLVIINNGANTLQIFPASGDDLGAGVNTATTLTAGSNAKYLAYDATNWELI